VSRDYGVSDFMVQAQRLDQELRAQLAEIEARTRTHRARIRGLLEQRDETLVQLVQVLLPDFSPASLVRAGRRVGFDRILLAEETTGKLEAERTALGQRLAQLEADPRYRDRELLRAPRVGQLAREVDELEDFRAPMAELWTSAQHLRLAELLQNGYGTEAYAVAFWRLSYYSDWKAGDEILARFPGKQSFAELRPELIAARDTLTVYDARLTELRAEIEAGERVERAHDETQARLRDLDAIHLDAWRGLLARHITETDLPELGDRLAGEEAAQLLLKTYAGVAKKIDYLEQVHEQQLGAQKQNLQEEIARLARERVKYARPKKAYTRFEGARFEKRFGDRSERYGKMWRRYDRTYDTVWGFADYERASLAEQFLWWDLFTDGQLDGNFIPEVQEFHRHHPGYSWRGDDLDDDLAGRAAAASIEADRSVGGDPSSFHDPS